MPWNCQWNDINKVNRIKSIRIEFHIWNMHSNLKLQPWTHLGCLSSDTHHGISFRMHSQMNTSDVGRLEKNSSDTDWFYDTILIRLGSADDQVSFGISK